MSMDDEEEFDVRFPEEGDGDEEAFEDIVQRLMQVLPTGRELGLPDSVRVCYDFDQFRVELVTWQWTPLASMPFNIWRLDPKFSTRQLFEKISSTQLRMANDEYRAYQIAGPATIH